jgi:hypothetical protein
LFHLIFFSPNFKFILIFHLMTIVIFFFFFHVHFSLLFALFNALLHFFSIQIFISAHFHLQNMVITYFLLSIKILLLYSFCSSNIFPAKDFFHFYLNFYLNLHDDIMDYKLFKIKSRRCFKLYFVLHNIKFSRELYGE